MYERLESAQHQLARGQPIERGQKLQDLLVLLGEPDALCRPSHG